MSKTKYYTFFLLFFSAFFACTVISDNSSDALKVLYDGKSVSSDKNIFTIYIPNSKGISDVGFTLEVGDGATLSYDNKALLLNEYNQYITNMDFSNGKQHTFFVTAQGGNVSTYIIRVQLMDSKEIISFTFFKKDNSDLEEDTAMDIDANGQVVSKTVTNVEKITQLAPTIVHNGSNVSPSSGVAQDFSTNNTYTVTAIDGTTSDYTVTLTNYYGVTINIEGGLITEAPTTEYILYGEKATLPSDPSQEHYGFKGWYDAVTGGNIFDFNTPITTATIVYAQWTNKQYKVSFNTDGVDAITPVMINSLTTVARPIDPISPEHYSSLEGWYTDNTFTTRYDFNWVVSNDLTLYAKYINKQYTISFDTDWGSAIDPVMVNSLNPVPKPVDPATNHYALESWYTDNTFTTRYDFNWVVSNDLTLYAKYTNKQYRVRFYQEEGRSLLSTIFITSLTKIAALDYPSASQGNYEWYTDTSVTQLYKSALVTGNLDLYAKEIKSFQAIIEGKAIPSDLANYGDMSETIFSNYQAGADVIARYVTTSGNGDGSSWANASGDMQAVVGGITDASESKVYVVLVASGTYKPANSYVMKNHVALVGGFTSGSYDRSGETRLDGNNNKRVFNNNNNGLDRTALLYGVVITGGEDNHGGGMNNSSSSPTLINVTFSDNKASGVRESKGGGMHNISSSFPTLINVTFSGNEASLGGGIANDYYSDPKLFNVTFSDNTAENGGGMYNDHSDSTLINVTFSDNTAKNGGGMYNLNYSSPTLNNVTFSGNTADDSGGGMLNNNNSSPTLINVTFSGNKADNGNGGGMYNSVSSPFLINVTFSDNNVNSGNGGGIYHDGNGQPLTLINTILWDNNNGNIYLLNDTTDTETVILYYSLIEGKDYPLRSPETGILLGFKEGNPVNIMRGENIFEENGVNLDPGLGSLANNGGGVNTISISSSSPAKDKGIYVKVGEANSNFQYYYSTNNTDWYSDPDLKAPNNLPSDADDLTATDARGYSRVGRPDMGAYEVGGTEQ